MVLHNMTACLYAGRALVIQVSCVVLWEKRDLQYCMETELVTEYLDSMYGLSPLYFPIKPSSPSRHMWLNLPRYWQVALCSEIGRSPNYFPWPITPRSHTLLPLDRSVCFGNCVWQAKEQAIHVKCEGEAFHSPLTATIWFDIGALLNSGVFKEGLTCLFLYFGP